MLAEIFRVLTRRNRESKREGKRGKRQSRRKHPESTRAGEGGGRSFTRTSADERQTMFALRQQGLGVHSIAKRMGRSTRTVHQVLTDYGARTMPERGAGAPEGEPKGRSDSGGRRKRRHRRRSGEVRHQRDLSDALLRKLQPRLIESVSQHLDDDPEMATQLMAAYMGVKIPRKSLDDVILEEIQARPDLRRQWAEDFLERKRRKGRTDTDIAGEVLDLACRIAERMARGQWVDVVKSALRGVHPRIALRSTHRVSRVRLRRRPWAPSEAGPVDGRQSMQFLWVFSPHTYTKQRRARAKVASASDGTAGVRSTARTEV